MLKGNLSQFIPKGRIVTLDILRGLAILVMTIYHQTIPFNLHSSGIGHQLGVFSTYYILTLFIAVSGIAIVFFEKKYHYPLQMVVHGIVLFMMAWCADLAAHQSFRIDWDIFQLIGICYAICGLFNYIERIDIRFSGIFILVVIWLIFRDIRPDAGLRPIWPYGIFFLGGYILGKWSTSRHSSMWKVLVMIGTCLVYLVFFYLFCKRSLELSTNAYGIIASFAGVYILLFFTLFIENQRLTRGPVVLLLKQFGVYPITLYYIQQFVTVFGPRIGLKISISPIPTFNYIYQTLLLVIIMFISTIIFGHIRFMCIEFWLKKTESIIMNVVPKRGIFKPLHSKSALG